MSVVDVREEPVLLTSEPAATARGRAGVTRRAGPTRALAGRCCAAAAWSA